MTDEDGTTILYEYNLVLYFMVRNDTSKKGGNAPRATMKRDFYPPQAIEVPSSIGHPPHSSASPVELRLRVGPRALSGKKKELR